MDNPVDQFIEIASDSTAKAATVPQQRNGKLTAASIEYELLGNQPYHYTLNGLMAKGRIAIYPVVSAEYKRFVQDDKVKKHSAMRSTR